MKIEVKVVPALACRFGVEPLILTEEERQELQLIAFYAQDAVTLGNLVVNIGFRLDHYDGLVSKTGACSRDTTFDLSLSKSVLICQAGRPALPTKRDLKGTCRAMSASVAASAHASHLLNQPDHVPRRLNHLKVRMGVVNQWVAAQRISENGGITRPQAATWGTPNRVCMLGRRTTKALVYRAHSRIF